MKKIDKISWLVSMIFLIILFSVYYYFVPIYYFHDKKNIEPDKKLEPIHKQKQIKKNIIEHNIPKNKNILLLEKWKKRGIEAEKQENKALALQCYAWALQYGDDDFCKEHAKKLESYWADIEKSLSENRVLLERAKEYESEENYQKALTLYQKLGKEIDVKRCIELNSILEKMNQFFNAISQALENGDCIKATNISLESWQWYHNHMHLQQDPFLKTFANHKIMHQELVKLHSSWEEKCKQKRYAVLLQEVQSLSLLNNTGLVKYLQNAITKNMVFVQEGNFIMGSDYDEKDECPEHTVFLTSFWIDTYEVSLHDYLLFVEETGREQPEYRVSNLETIDENLPVTGISWKDASDYAQWLGKRLPTEEEWEKAARGTLGTYYSWGNEYDSTKQIMSCVPVYTPGTPSPFGCLHMSDNVSEWTSSLYKPYSGNQESFMIRDNTRVARGSSWLYTQKATRCSNRFPFSENTKLPSLGFRCAYSFDNESNQ